jgi:hypothetical protein
MVTFSGVEEVDAVFPGFAEAGKRRVFVFDLAAKGDPIK